MTAKEFLLEKIPEIKDIFNTYRYSKYDTMMFRDIAAEIAALSTEDFVVSCVLRHDTWSETYPDPKQRTIAKIKRWLFLGLAPDPRKRAVTAEIRVVPTEIDQRQIIGGVAVVGGAILALKMTSND
jgi:hypothetical protein